MHYVAENLRFLLWREGVDRSEWAGQLAAWAACDLGRAAELLEKGNANPVELAQVGRRCTLGTEELQFGRLAAGLGSELLTENLRDLIGGLPRGEKAALASRVGVNASTLSRWLSGRQQPATPKQSALVAQLGLRPETNLQEEPLFLSIPPVGVSRQRLWLHERVDQLDAEDLIELFPALWLLLRRG